MAVMIPVTMTTMPSTQKSPVHDVKSTCSGGDIHVSCESLGSPHHPAPQPDPRAGQGTSPPHLGLEAEDGDNDGHNGSDEHGDQDSFGLVHAVDGGDTRVTPCFGSSLPREVLVTSHGPSPGQGTCCLRAQRTGVSPGKLSFEPAMQGATGGTPAPVTTGSSEHTWRLYLSSNPWPTSAGEKGRLSRAAAPGGQVYCWGQFLAAPSLPTRPPIPPRPPGELGCHGGTPGPPTSPSPLTKMLSRMMFQGKRLLGTKTEKRGELVTVAMSCPPGSQPPGTAPGKDPSRCPKDPPYPQSPTPWVPATSDSPGTLAAGQHHVGHQEHSAAERDSGCQPWDPFGLGGSDCGVPAVGGHPRGAQAGDPLLTMRHSRWQRSSGQKSGQGSCRMEGMSVREGGQQLLCPQEPLMGDIGPGFPLFWSKDKEGHPNSHEGEHSNDSHCHQQLQGDDGVDLRETRGSQHLASHLTGAPRP